MGREEYTVLGIQECLRTSRPPSPRPVSSSGDELVRPPARTAAEGHRAARGKEAPGALSAVLLSTQIHFHATDDTSGFGIKRERNTGQLSGNLA